MSLWWCHADDDTYLNVKQLYKLLSYYDPTKPWYIGKISTSIPITILVGNVNSSYFVSIRKIFIKILKLFKLDF